MADYRPTLVEGRTQGLEKWVKEAQEFCWAAGAVDAQSPFWTWGSVRRAGLDSDRAEDWLKAKTIWIDGDYGPLTKEAMAYVQCRHVNKQGFYLNEVEQVGVTGLDTWDVIDKWYAGEYYVQDIIDVRSAIDSYSDNDRYRVCQKAYSYLGVSEKPMGSNRGEEVDYFKGNSRNWAWCQCYVHRVFKDVMGYYPVGPASKVVRKTWNLTPATRQARLWAKELQTARFGGKSDWWKSVDTIHILPPEVGDIYNLDYGRISRSRAGRGHTGFVAALVYKNGKLVEYITISGNESDRVKEGRRLVSNGSLAGFIDPYSVDCKLGDNFKNIYNDIDITGNDKTT